MVNEITFEKGKKELWIKRNGKNIGQIFVENPEGKGDIIQVCGFDRIDGPWGCGPFPGHRDIHLIFDEECEHDWECVGFAQQERAVYLCKKCKLYKVDD